MPRTAQGMARRPGPDGPASCSSGGTWSGSGAPIDWSERDRLIGGLASEGIRPVPFVWGSPSWVGNGTRRAAPDRQPRPTGRRWQNFLKAAVARYGPGGSYWANKYRQDFPGAGAAPLPIQSWQIWNEPNLKKYFSPGSTTQAAAQKYAQLLAIAHDAIKRQGPAGPGRPRRNAQHPGRGGRSKAWDFLNALYAVAGAKADFDVAALHPYGCNLEQTRHGIAKFSAVDEEPRRRGDAAVADRVRLGIGGPRQLLQEQGPHGSARPARQLLQADPAKPQDLEHAAASTGSCGAIAEPGSVFAGYCSICGTAGLLRYNRTAKPAYTAFRGFTAETTPPVASITAGPTQGSFINDSTPTFSFASNEAGSTFVCRFDAAPFTACSSPYTRGRAAPERPPHLLTSRRSTPPGTRAQIRSRSFTVDTVAAPDHDHIRALGVDHGQDAHLHVLGQRVGLDLRLSLRRPGVRPLLGAGRQPHPLDPAHRRQPQLRRPGHRQGQEHRRDARQAHVLGHLLAGGAPRSRRGLGARMSDPSAPARELGTL